jgi:hypothetical protein
MPSTATVATEADQRAMRRTSARRERYGARSILWRESSLRRVKNCGKAATGDTVTIKATTTDQGTRAGFGGVQSCGSVWACPVCSEKINAERQGELSRGIASWMSDGHAVVFGTLTLRHNKGHRLAQLLDAISPAWNRTTSGAGVAWNGGKREIGDKARFGIHGYVRVLEVKCGCNGWHPHVHFLLFLERELTTGQMLDLEARMFGRWETALAKRGFSTIREVGIDLRPVREGDGLGDYFTKATYATTPSGAAYEVTGSHSKREGKGGRTPFDLLRSVVETGDADDLDRWQEYEQATHNRRQLTWSRGLRALLALGAERTEEEIVEDDQGGEIVAVIDKGDYRRLAVAGLLVDVLEMAEADTTGRRLRAFLERFGCVALVEFTQRGR